MAYRKHEKIPSQKVFDVSTGTDIIMMNGATTSVEFKCMYMPTDCPPIDKEEWDHNGWPTPTKPDASCQFDVPIFRHCIFSIHRCCSFCGYCSNATPIHLIEEGYDRVSISFEENELNLKATAWIDEGDDWIIRATFDATDSPDLTKKEEIRFSVFAEQQGSISDVVTTGKIVITPGPGLRKDQ